MGSSTPSVLGGELHNSQRDHNTYTFNNCTLRTYVSTLTIRLLWFLEVRPDAGESISDTLRSTSAATETVGHEGLIGSTRVQMDCEKYIPSPPITPDAKAASAMEGVEYIASEHETCLLILLIRATISSGTSCPVRKTQLDQGRSLPEERSLCTDSGMYWSLENVGPIFDLVVYIQALAVLCL